MSRMSIIRLVAVAVVMAGALGRSAEIAVDSSFTVFYASRNFDGIDEATTQAREAALATTPRS